MSSFPLTMPSDLSWRRGGMLLSTVAAAAVAEVQDRIMDHAAHMGRSGVVVRLRTAARDLAQSGVGRDQVRACAFEAAADDVAWGRAPLADWRTFAIDAAAVPEEDRAALQASLPLPDKAVRALGEQVARDIERRLLSTGDAFDAIRRLPAELAASAELQEALWDDPRIPAAPQVRRFMYASVAPLQRRLGSLDRHARPATPREITPRVSAWRRFFAVR